MEPQTETTPMAEPEVQGEEQNLAQKGKKQKRIEQVRAEQTEESEDDKAFISDEAYSLWEKNLTEKGFIGERGFGKFISPFAEIIEKRGWNLAQTTRLCYSSQGILWQHDRNERRFSIH